MMRIHKEGRLIIPISLAILVGIWCGLYFPFLQKTTFWWLGMILAFAGMIMFGLILNFFRNPVVKIQADENGILAPADGKVVVIEEVQDSIYLNGPVRQISIFMSPLNVHVNRNPISGKLVFHKYFPGKYLVAYNPKSSTENEQTYFVIENERWTVAFKQIAGAVARRIRWYVKEGDTLNQGEEMGFIRFGSRIDVLVPLDAEILVELEENVRGAVTMLARAPGSKKQENA